MDKEKEMEQLKQETENFIKEQTLFKICSIVLEEAGVVLDSGTISDIIQNRLMKEL